MEGAGVYDIDGALCAMAVAGPRGKTLAIPVETIAHVAKKVLAAGYLAHPFIGVRLAQVWLDEEQRTEFGHDRGEAILVTGVERDSPAMQSGLAFGDVILRAGDRSIHSPAGLAREIRAADLGASLRLEIRRGGSPRTLDVIVGERPRH